MANEMNNKPDTSGTHIWLRYTTQFTSGKRTHTVEVGIPVPIGASVETRERLIREAEVGMEQLAGHMERRVEQMQRGEAAPSAASAAGSAQGCSNTRLVTQATCRAAACPRSRARGGAAACRRTARSDDAAHAPEYWREYARRAGRREQPAPIPPVH